MVAIVQQYGAVRLITWSRAARDEIARQLDSISPGASKHVTYIVDLGSVAHLQAHGGGPVVVDCTSGTAADHPGPWVSLARRGLGDGPGAGTRRRAGAGVAQAEPYVDPLVPQSATVR